jgi:hypothetical protein
VRPAPFVSEISFAVLPVFIVPKEAELIVIGRYPSVILNKVKAGILHDEDIVWTWPI